MRLTAFILLIYWSIPLHAQYNDLLQNPKISWVAEYTADYELNPAYNNRLETEPNLLELVRLENTGAKNGLYADSETNVPYYLSQQLFEGLKTGAFEAFSDAALKTPLTAEQIRAHLVWKDTSYLEDGSLFVAENEYTAESFVTFRVRQVVYFDRSKRRFGLRVLALAPIPWAKDEAEYMTPHEPFAWIRLPELSKKEQKQLARSANYILQTRLKNNAPFADELLVQKGSLHFRDWAGEEVNNPSHTVLSPDAYAPLSKAALQSLVFTADTLTTFNEDGQSVIDRIVPQNALDDVERIRFVQDWYYDERRRILDCRLVAVAPIATIQAGGGLFQFDKPLFYLRY